MAGTRKPRNYVNNPDLLEEIAKSKKIQEEHPDWFPSQCLTPKLVDMLVKLVSNYGIKSSWRNYSYNEDMQAEAIAGLCQNALKFDAEKSQNPFSYYTMVAKRCFLTLMEKEAKQREIRDDLIEVTNDTDFKPSFARQDEEQLDKLNYVKHSMIQPAYRRRK